jgi:tetratricopeptide (TPR) repeat protein
MFAGMAFGVLASVAMAGETPEELFENLYGKEARRAAAVPREAAAFAATLIDAAAKVTDSPPVAALLCRKAYELAMKDKSGLATAMSSLDMLDKIDPNAVAETADKAQKLYEYALRAAAPEAKKKAAEALLSRLAALAEAHLAAGKAAEAADEFRRASQVASAINDPAAGNLQSRMKDAVAADKFNKEAARLAGLLANDPKNHEVAKRLMMLYLVEGDDPAKAGGLTGAAEADERFRTYLPLAAKPVKDLDQQVLMELGNWYRSLGDGAAPANKVRMLVRAKGYYESFMEVHGAQDMQRIKAKLAVDEVNLAIDKAAAGGVVFRGSDLVADFSAKKNPNGPWSYGWAPANKVGGFMLFDTHSQGLEGSPVFSNKGGNPPSLWRNFAKQSDYGVAPGEVSLHGGPNNEMTIVRWTSPLTSRVKLSGAFGQGHTGSVDAIVAKTASGRTTVLFSKMNTLTTEPFSFVVEVKAGDKLDFVVGTAGYYAADNTPLSVRIALAR